MAAVRSLCTRGVMLKNGMIDFMGSIPETLDHYLKTDDGIKQEKIIDNIQWIRQGLIIHKIEINGTDEATSTITSKQQYLDIHIEAETKENLIYDIMFIFKNKDGMPMACYANGHYYGEINHQPAGKFTINKHIILPKILNKGILKVDMYFHHPMVEFQLKAPSCCTLECEGFQSEYGKFCHQEINGLMGFDDTTK
jgi:lipopolysaccharide transport system ATP-binding protein